MKNKLISLLAVVGTIALSSYVNAQGHYHMYVGAAGTNQNDQLRYEDEDSVSIEHGFVSTLTFAGSGKYAGYYQGNLTISVLSTTPTNTAYSPDAPAPGARVFAQLASVEGPPGGAFGFWETNSTSPAFSLESGTTGTNLWLLSEKDGSPGTDPYGHIHGRRYTATKPGIYTVGFRAADISTNGASGGPIHSLSDIFKVYFQAGVNIASLVKTNDEAFITFGATGGRTFALQYNSSLTNSNGWTQTGGTVPGDDHFQVVKDTNATNSIRFYRIKDVTEDGPPGIMRRF